MAFPTFQQVATGHGTIFTPVTFGSPNGEGNGIIATVALSISTGVISTVTLTDNNGNIYTPIPGSAPSSKANAWQFFACTNLRTTPNATLALTVGFTTGGGGSVVNWSIVACEFNNVSKTNIVATTKGQPTTPTVLTGQPSGTSIVCAMPRDSEPFSPFMPYPNWDLSLPSNFLWLATDDSGVGTIAGTMGYLPNSPSGTISFDDNASQWEALIVLAPLIPSSSQGAMSVAGVDDISASAQFQSMELSPRLGSIRTVVMSAE